MTTKGSNLRIPSDSVFLVGSGIIDRDRSWKPIIAAIQEFKPDARVETDEQANYFLAWWVYAQRMRAVYLMGDKTSAEGRERNRQLANDDVKLKQIIAASLRSACDGRDFQLRPRFVEVQGLAQWGSRLFFTTNWDRLLEIQLGRTASNCVHIHGDVEAPSCLYLPTETSTEHHREAAANKQIGLWTGTAWQIIRDTRQLCIYGLSLSAHDAELTWILTAGLSEHTARPLPIHLFDLGNKLPEIEWRVRMACLPSAKVEIIHHPVDDDAPVT